MVSPETFTVGMLVEATINVEGYRGAWFEGRILRTPSTERRRSSRNMSYLVEFQSLLANDGGELLKEFVGFSFLRPLPPPPSPEQIEEGFRVGEVVDAYYNDGWWIGVVCKVFDEVQNRPKSYNVTFDNPPDLQNFPSSALRVHLDWVDGDWFKPPIKKQRLKVVGCSSSKRKREEHFSQSLEGLGEKLDDQNDIVERTVVEEGTARVVTVSEKSDDRNAVDERIVVGENTPKSHTLSNFRDLLLGKVGRIEEKSVSSSKLRWVKPPVKRPRLKLVRSGSSSRKRQDHSSSILEGEKLDDTENGSRAVAGDSTPKDPPLVFFRSPPREQLNKSEDVVGTIVEENTPSDASAIVNNPLDVEENTPRDALAIFNNPLDENDDVARTVVEESTARDPTIATFKNWSGENLAENEDMATVVEENTPTDPALAVFTNPSDANLNENEDVVRTTVVENTLTTPTDHTLAVSNIPSGENLAENEDMTTAVEENTPTDPALAVFTNPSDENLNENEDVVRTTVVENTPTTPTDHTLTVSNIPSGENLAENEDVTTVVEENTSMGPALAVFTNPSDENLNESEDVIRTTVVENTPNTPTDNTPSVSSISSETGEEQLSSSKTVPVNMEDDIVPNIADVDELISSPTVTADPIIHDETPINGTSEDNELHDNSVPCGAAVAMVDDAMSCERPSLQVCEVFQSLLSSIQSIEVFQQMPQKPHFRPLENLNEKSRKGLVVAQWFTFANLAEDILQLDIDTFDSITFDNILECLLDLESSGFDVIQMQTRVQELKSIKDRVEERQARCDQLQCEIRELKLKMNENKAMLDAATQELEDIEKQLKAAQGKRKLLSTRMEEVNANITKLQLDQHSLAEEMLKAQTEFKALATSGW